MNLTTGALARICDGQEVADPVLQVLGHKPIHFGVTRYRLLLSDGQYSNSFSMMASQLNNLIHENQLSQYSIIRVKKHVCNTTDDLSKKVLVILELEVLKPGSEVGKRLGSPVNIGPDGKISVSAKWNTNPKSGAASKRSIDHVTEKNQPQDKKTSSTTASRAETAKNSSNIELDKDYEFLAAAVSALTGGLVVASEVPGPHTTIPPPYHPDYLLNKKNIDICDFNSFNNQTRTWFCPQPPQESLKETPLSIKTIWGASCSVLIDQACSVRTLREKIQESSLGLPADAEYSLVGDDGRRKFPMLENWRPILEYKIKDVYLSMRLRAGPPPPPAAYASLLDKGMFDFSKNYDFTWLQDNDQTSERPSDNKCVYKKPYGWNKVALNDKDKCDDNCDPTSAYEACEDFNSEWAMAYYGQKDLYFKLLKTEDSNREKASQLVRGIYSCPDPASAVECAPVFTFRSRKFKVMIQCRVNMKNTTTIGDLRLYSTRSPEDIKPVGLLVKSID